jgi:hypothetical protein
MVGTLLVIGIIVGFALYQYIKGGIVVGFIFLMAVIIGTAMAFGYYEQMAGYVKDYDFIGAKAYPLAFFVLFIASFILVKEVANQVLKPDISFGAMIDKVGGVILGMLVGYIFAGAMLVVIGLMPYKINWLYGRFNDNLDNPPLANRKILNPDGFLSGVFSMLSNGSLRGTNSFAMVHADYIDQIFLNRHLISEGIMPIAANDAVSLAIPGVRPAPEDLMAVSEQKDQPPQSFTPEPGKILTLMRLQINATDLIPGNAGEVQPKLALSQLRLVLKEKQDAGTVSSGFGEVVYPIGYINSAGQLQTKPLNAILGKEEFGTGALDFAFNIPASTTPVLIEFRHNIIEEIRPMAAPAAQPPSDQPAAPQPSEEPNTTEPPVTEPNA